MAETDWSNNAVKYLVKEYEKRQELWNKDHNLYRVQAVKHTAWTAIANMFSCDVTDLRKKFNSVLASYRRERAKVKEGGRSTWFLYPHMKFLPGYIKSKELEEQEEIASDHIQQEETIVFETFELESDVTHVSDAEEQEEEQEILIKHEPDVEAYSHKRFVTSGNHSKKRLTRTLKRKPRRHIPNAPPETYSKAYIDSKLQDMQRKIRNDSLRKKDDCDTYGEYIASTLRKHDNKTQCMIKQAINNILFEQEMNKYENPLDNDMVSEILDPSDD